MYTLRQFHDEVKKYSSHPCCNIDIDYAGNVTFKAYNPDKGWTHGSSPEECIKLLKGETGADIDIRSEEEINALMQPTLPPELYTQDIKDPNPAVQEILKNLRKKESVSAIPKYASDEEYIDELLGVQPGDTYTYTGIGSNNGRQFRCIERSGWRVFYQEGFFHNEEDCEFVTSSVIQQPELPFAEPDVTKD